METDTRALLDKMFPRPWPSRRRRRKLSPIKKKRGGSWNLKPFVKRSNRKRANAVIRLKNKIRMQNPMLGRRFRGGIDLIDPERPWQYQQDTQVYFCGADGPPEVYENFKIDRGFEDGVGLYLVVDADYITREVVERVIDRFFCGRGNGLAV